MSTLNTAVVAGASGYIGQQLVRHVEASAITVRTIGRGAAADAQWHDENALAAVLDGADLLVKSGRPLGQLPQHQAHRRPDLRLSGRHHGDPRPCPGRDRRSADPDGIAEHFIGCLRLL